MRRLIKSVRVEYLDATGAPVLAYKIVQDRSVWGATSYQKVQARWVGGIYRIYCTKENGELTAFHIPGNRIIDITVEYQA